MYREDLKVDNKIELVEKVEMPEPKTIDLKAYRSKFEKVTAHRLAESSTIHCADGRKLLGNAGDYYVQLDRVQEFMLPEEIFRKLFILDVEK